MHKEAEDKFPFTSTAISVPWGLRVIERTCVSTIHWCRSGVHTLFVRPTSSHRLRLSICIACCHCHRSLLKPSPVEERPCLLQPGRIYLSADHPPLYQLSMDSSESPPPRSERHTATTHKLNILSLSHTLVTIVKPNFLQHALDSKEASHSLPSKHSNCTFSPPPPPLPSVHLFRISESRLDARIADNLIFINDYTVLRRDIDWPLHTGLALCVYKPIENSVRRWLEPKIEATERSWIEITYSKTKPLLVGYVYRNPASPQGLHDDFINMMDKVTESNANILLLGDFNIVVLKQLLAWNNITCFFGLEQLVEEATRVTKSSATLIDHIFLPTINHRSLKLKELNQSLVTLFFWHWPIKLSKQKPKWHTTITFRSFKKL